MLKLSNFARSLALMGAVTLASGAQAELVTNGGFETGNFSGWTQVGNTGFTGVNGGSANSGSFGAFFGPIGSTGGITQTLATTAGASYQVSFWLLSDGGTPNVFNFNWDGGASELSFSNLGAQGFTQYVFTLMASGAATTIQFDFQDNPGFLLFDDVSVNAAVPEPGSLALAGLALAMVGLASRRKAAV